ncbi:hypothetical protein ABZP36_005350 [Zizania latifolia]
MAVADVAFKALTAGLGVATLYLAATFSVNVYRGLSWHSEQSVSKQTLDQPLDFLATHWRATDSEFPDPIPLADFPMSDTPLRWGRDEELRTERIPLRPRFIVLHPHRPMPASGSRFVLDLISRCSSESLATCVGGSKLEKEKRED